MVGGGGGVGGIMVAQGNSSDAPPAAILSRARSRCFYDKLRVWGGTTGGVAVGAGMPTISFPLRAGKRRPRRLSLCLSLIERVHSTGGGGRGSDASSEAILARHQLCFQSKSESGAWRASTQACFSVGRRPINRGARQQFEQIEIDIDHAQMK